MEKRGFVLIGITVVLMLFVGCVHVVHVPGNAMNGRVETISQGIIGVRGDDGRFFYFQTGWETRYVPNRLPGIGEYVQVTYSVDGPTYVGQVFTVLSPPSPPPAETPPPPPGPYIGPTDPYRGR